MVIFSQYNVIRYVSFDLKKKIVESVSRIEGFQVGHDLAFLTRNNHL